MKDSILFTALFITTIAITVFSYYGLALIVETVFSIPELTVTFVFGGGIFLAPLIGWAILSKLLEVTTGEPL